MTRVVLSNRTDRYKGSSVVNITDVSTVCCSVVRALVVTSFSCGQFSKFLVLFLKLVHKLVNQAKLCVLMTYVFCSENETETPGLGRI